MKLAAILLLFLLVGAMARPEASELSSLQERSVDSPLNAPAVVKLSVVHRRSTSGSYGNSENRGQNSLSLIDSFLGPELGGNVRQLLGILGVHDIRDMPRLISRFADGTALRPLIKLLNSVSPTDIRRYLENSDPLQSVIKGIPIIGTLASYAGHLSNLPSTIIDSIVNLVMHIIRNMTNVLTGMFL